MHRLLTLGVDHECGCVLKCEHAWGRAGNTTSGECQYAGVMTLPGAAGGSKCCQPILSFHNSSDNSCY